VQAVDNGNVSFANETARALDTQLKCYRIDNGKTVLKIVMSISRRKEKDFPDSYVKTVLKFIRCRMSRYGTNT
jgi:hypothetical protein